MPATGTDLVMIERAGVLHKATAQEIADLGAGGGGGSSSHTVIGSYPMVETTAVTTEQDILNFEVPAGALGTDKQMRLHFGGRIRNSSGGAATVRFRIYYGATKLFDDVTASIASNANDRGVWFTLLLTAQGTTNSQDLAGLIAVGGTGAATTGRGDLGSDEITSHAAIDGESLIDSTVAQTFRVAVVLSAANAEFWVRRYRCIAEVLG